MLDGGVNGVWGSMDWENGPEGSSGGFEAVVGACVSG